MELDERARRATAGRRADADVATYHLGQPIITRSITASYDHYAGSETPSATGGTATADTVLLPHLRVRPGRYSRIRRERRSPMELWDEAIPSRRVHICVRSRQARERARLRGEDPYAPVLGLPVDAGAHYYQTVDRRLLHCGELTVAQTCGLRLQATVSSQLSGRRETWENEMRDGCPDP